MNEHYRALSEEEKQLKRNKISEIVKKQHKNFETKYTMIEGLIKPLHNKRRNTKSHYSQNNCFI